MAKGRDRNSERKSSMSATAIAPFPPTVRPFPEGAQATRELLQYVPQLSTKERDRRWNATRKRMIHSGIDALVFLGTDISVGSGMGNVRYIFQVGSVFGADGLFPLTGEPVIWNNIPHMYRPTPMFLSTQEWMTDFRLMEGPSVIADEIISRGLDHSRIGLVGFSSALQRTPTYLHTYIVELEKLLPNVQFVDSTGLIQEMRMVKSEEEIGMMRKAGKIARKVVDAMVSSARAGVPDAVVYAEMIKTQIANGADPLIFNLFSAGPVEHPQQELWHLLHGCEQPLTPSMRPLKKGDLVISEYHTQYGGYRVHTEYTVYLGKKAPKELLNIWDVSVETLLASKEALIPGRTIREAIKMIRKPAKKAGLDWVELGFQTKGTASPEFPTVVYEDGYGPAQLRSNCDLVLEEGMTMGNNIDIHDSRWKPDVGCMLADFMVVRPGGAECLIGTPLEMAQIG
jgi:Xaa-Pro aminopeptidase